LCYNFYFLAIKSTSSGIICILIEQAKKQLDELLRITWIVVPCEPYMYINST
jgi:hypothetical protein